MNSFERRVHYVKDEWHYKIMTKYGFSANTEVQIGFIRSYEYENKEGHKVYLHTGANADYWTDGTKGGYHGTLKDYLKNYA